jgi:Phosphodiester glycosidase
MRASALRSPEPLPSVTRFRAPLADGAATSVHVAAFPLARVAVRVVRLERPETLVAWCRRTRVANAIVGGFFVRAGNDPLGQLRIGGADVAHVPFTAPWGALRACLHVGRDGVAIAPRPALPAVPDGDLLQAGPLLVRGGATVVTGADDEGFSAAADQFDSDISDGRYPRCALALTDDRVLALACDGRHSDEAGLTLAELADVLVGLGARTALNLDGGGSASLVCHGELVNRPREQHGIELLEGRPIATALAFEVV